MEIPNLTFTEGYEFVINNAGAAIGADVGAAYIGRVEDAIAELANAINTPTRRIENVDVEYLKGFIAEQLNK